MVIYSKRRNTIENRYFHGLEGHIEWGLVSVSLVRGQNGEALYFVGQFQRITDRKIAELQLELKAEELLRAKEFAVEAAQAKSQFCWMY